MGQTIVEKIKKYWRKKKASKSIPIDKGVKNETKRTDSKTH